MIAAATAASASLLSLVINVVAQRLAERRTAIRAAVAKDLDELGNAIHQVVATSTVFVRKTEYIGSTESWIPKLQSAKKKLEDVRLRVRYSLSGIDIGLRTLTRLPSWIQHKQRDTPEARRLLNAAENLRGSLDGVIVHCYRKGRWPNWWQRRRIKRKSQVMENAFNREVDVPDVSSDEKAENANGK